MGEFWNRLKSHGPDRIPVDYASMTFAAWAENDVTAPQALAIINGLLPPEQPLGAEGQQEVQDLRATIVLSATGSSQLNRIDRATRIQRIQRTFQLVETGQPPYTDLSPGGFVATLLGVTIR